MTKSRDELLAMRIGKTTIGENIRRAVEAGNVIEHEDGTLQLAADRQRARSWIHVDNAPPLGCEFLKHFLFRHAYGKSAVPQGCSACYKVKVAPRTLRGLVAALDLAKRIECRSKWGIDIDNPDSQDIYAGYFFATGLDMARAIFKIVREAINADPRLGPAVVMTIKRGCSEYEAELGPSERYEFAPELAELEAYLKTRFHAGKAEHRGSIALGRWIETAFRIGDDTYLDFTGGKRLRRAMTTYDP
jgi:hypothetical protein